MPTPTMFATCFNRPLLILLVLFVGLPGCDSGTQISPLSPTATILSFGDSLTYGTGASADQSYPAQLQLITGLSVVRSGVPGELSAEGLKRLPALLDQHQPQLLILCHGGNDLLRKRDISQLKTNLAAMIELAQQRDIQVLLVAVPKPSLLLSVEPLYAELAEQYRLAQPVEVLEDILADNRLKSDSIHPNAEGYRLLAEALAQQLRNLGAL